MKVFKKMALVALLAATTQSFAGEIMSSSEALPGPAVSETGGLAPMSISELASVEGGTFFAPISSNQMIMSIIGGVAYAVGGAPGLYITVGPVGHSGAKVIDHLFCSVTTRMATVMLLQSQFAALRAENDRTAGYADMAIALTYGIGFQLLATGCHYAATVIEQKITVKQQLNEIKEKKGRKLLALPDDKSRKMLTDKWWDQDRWVAWALSTANTERDSILYNRDLELETLRLRSECVLRGPAVYPACVKRFTDELGLVMSAIETHTSNFKKAVEQNGLAQRDHAVSLGVFNRELFNKGNKLSYEID